MPFWLMNETNVKYNKLKEFITRGVEIIQN